MCRLLAPKTKLNPKPYTLNACRLLAPKTRRGLATLVTEGGWQSPQEAGVEANVDLGAIMLTHRALEKLRHNMAFQVRADVAYFESAPRRRVAGELLGRGGAPTPNARSLVSTKWSLYHWWGSPWASTWALCRRNIRSVFVSHPQRRRISWPQVSGSGSGAVSAQAIRPTAPRMACAVDEEGRTKGPHEARMPRVAADALSSMLPA